MWARDAYIGEGLSLGTLKFKRRREQGWGRFTATEKLAIIRWQCHEPENLCSCQNFSYWKRVSFRKDLWDIILLDSSSNCLGWEPEKHDRRILWDKGWGNSFVTDLSITHSQWGQQFFGANSGLLSEMCDNLRAAKRIHPKLKGRIWPSYD